MPQEIEPFAWSLSDGDLLADFLRRPEGKSFTVLVERHGGMVMRVCRSRLGNTQDAEDASQAVFLTLAERAKTLRGRAELVGWLYRVAWFIAARAVEARDIRRKHEQEAARMKKETSDMESADIPTEQLHAGMEKLPDKYLMPLLLHHVEGHTEAQTAALLGCSVSAASVRLSRGRKMLHQQLLKQGVGASAVAVTAAITRQASASVSPAFVASTSQMALSVAGGQVMAAGASWMTLALSKGAVHMLAMAKMKLMITSLAALLVLATGLTTYLVAANLSNSNSPQPAPKQIAQAIPAGKPAAQPSGWMAFKNDGIEVVECVEVNAGQAQAMVALLPDGAWIQMLKWEVAATPEEMQLSRWVEEAGIRVNRELAPIPFTDDQWAKLARITQAPPRWELENPTDASAVAAFGQMKDWLKLSPGAARDAFNPKLVDAVRKATADLATKANDKFQDKLKQAREIMTDAQRTKLHERFAPSAPATQPTTKPWVLPKFRGDGVYPGRILTAGYQAANGLLQVAVIYGAGWEVSIPHWQSERKADVWTQTSLGVTPDFLGGDAQLSLSLSLFNQGKALPGRAGRDALDPSQLVRKCLDRGLDLADFDLTKDQLAKIDQLHKKEIELQAKLLPPPTQAQLDAQKNQEDNLKKYLVSKHSDEAAIQEAIARSQAAFKANLRSRLVTFTPDDTKQIQACITDWWQAHPSRDAAAAALMKCIKDVADKKMDGYSQDEALWTEMGAVLTNDQKQDMKRQLGP